MADRLYFDCDKLGSIKFRIMLETSITDLAEMSEISRCIIEDIAEIQESSDFLRTSKLHPGKKCFIQTYHVTGEEPRFYQATIDVVYPLCIPLYQILKKGGKL